MTGICGSGIIEAVAEMRLAGLLDESGLIGSPVATGTKRSKPDGRTYSYELYDTKDASQSPIQVTQGVCPLAYCSNENLRKLSLL